eukprot:7702121-Karenia_brevis.AAC.1
MCKREQFWHAWHVDPPLFPNSRVTAGIEQYGRKIMLNGKRYDNPPDDWQGTEREWRYEIWRFKQLILDTHQAQRSLRQIIVPEGPPALQPASQGFHSTVFKFARQFQCWFTSIYGSVHSMTLDEPGIGRFPRCGRPWMIPPACINEGNYP